MKNNEDEDEKPRSGSLDSPSALPRLKELLAGGSSGTRIIGVCRRTTPPDPALAREASSETVPGGVAPAPSTVSPDSVTRTVPDEQKNEPREAPETQCKTQ
mmetsp:Transcript_25450/g.76429  ORF Transcript_25450/g.76429 Transcript_25450/m.76429 type:complete len:101 (+) Transcript_25450:340-642(+)